MQFANKMHTHTHTHIIHYNDEKNKIKNTNLLVCVACKISNYTKNLEESTETCQVEWSGVSSFLTAHQHIKGYFVPSRLLCM